MDEEVVQFSSLNSLSNDSLYPMCFGVSCALVALDILSGSGTNVINHQLSVARDTMLQGSAHLLGLLIWRIQNGETTKPKSEMEKKLEKTKIEVEELKRLRSEDAKANEKVVGIFASQEQSWFSEKKKLQQQITALLNELRVLEMKTEETISDLNKNIQEKELLLESRMKTLEEEEGLKRKKLELKLEVAEELVKELRETANKETKEHNSQLWHYKTALFELVSKQRQLEDEVGQALIQLEVSKQDHEIVRKQKDKYLFMVQKLALEIVKIRKGFEEKDKILSTMLKKSKIDSVEKEILSKELKISKVRRKQAEVETEQWKRLYASKHESDSSTTNLAYQNNSRLKGLSWAKEIHTIETTSLQHRRIRSCHLTNNRMCLKTEAEHRTKRRRPKPKKTNTKIFSSHKYDLPSLDGDAYGELGITTDYMQFEGWFRSETEKKTTMLEQRHHLEIYAFAEQLRLKDEKLEAIKWKLISMELESKRLKSNIEELDQNLSQQEEENMKLESLLMDRETELECLKDEIIRSQLQHPQYRKIYSNSSPKYFTRDLEPLG